MQINMVIAVTFKFKLDSGGQVIDVGFGGAIGLEVRQWAITSDTRHEDNAAFGVFTLD